ncbi:methylmalonate-semialdehyde dehydrogenase [acylating], mitochondrial [Trifolium repens]|nr:methylmalonate-semialdehyde dehydrogenase [acylating], mitochondrial [Trifolium repens]
MERVAEEEEVRVRNEGSMVKVYFQVEAKFGNSNFLQICCCKQKNLDQRAATKGASVMLAELALEVGLPEGVLNIVHGTHDIVNAICDDDDIKAISFVGLNVAGMHIYSRAAAKGKRVQSNMGAKNHAIVMPDANVDATINASVY